MLNADIIEFINSFNYDIKKTNNARWIDQKYIPDVISIVADCILEFTNYDENIIFKISDIWLNEYTKQNVMMIFAKPSTDLNETSNEYDKFFAQPINLLTYRVF
ncbi:hypothetical protein [Campylobacter sp. LR291e]|uniref:hypothetical protein n=1 Tax=unclassified Campylobacter TaxID=2593542 RepID=UPI003988D9BA